MTVRRTSIALAGAILLGACSDQAAAPTAPARRAVVASDAGSPDAADRVFVIFKNPSRIPDTFAARVAELGGTVESAHEAVGVATVRGLTEAAAASLGASADVASVDRDESFSLETRSIDADLATILAESGSSVDATAAAGANTAFYGKRQWNFLAIGADKAWAAGQRGSSAVKVAILDTGIDPTFPDLTSLIDVAHSASFVPADTIIAKQLFPGRTLPAWVDLHGHGTHVASTVSSKGQWVSGVTSQTTLMAIKVLGANGGGTDNAIFQGLIYAVQNGADVVNMSLGGAGTRAHSGGFGAINRVLNYAHRMGVTVVVSAGNDGWDLQHNGSGYSAFCDAPNVICVAATGPTTAGPGQFINAPNDFTGPFDDLDQPAFYTNYGVSAINVAGPGGNAKLDDKGKVLDAGWVWQACSKFGLSYNKTTKVYSKGLCATVPQLHLPNGYVGTSQAAPHVAALAAMLVPTLGRSPAQIRARIQQTADDVAGTPTSPFYGKGRINVARALGVI